MAVDLGTFTPLPVPIDLGVKLAPFGNTEEPTPPVVSNVSPAPGTTLQPGGLIAFDVTDDSGEFRRILLSASFGALPTRELVHDGDTFAPLYAAGSSRTAIEGGFRFVLQRSGGWPAAPTLTPFAIDTRGAENV